MKPAGETFRSEKTKRLRGFAKSMRYEPTEPERLMWSLLRNRRFVGRKFRRQVPVGPYIVDFFCPAAKLIIELDGSQHAGSARDGVRDAYLAAQGFRILRIWNTDILARPGQVMDAVWAGVGEQ